MKNSVLLGLIFVAMSQTMYLEAKSKELVVYSARKEHLIKPLFKQYENETGIKIRYSTNNAAALVEKLKSEGQKTPADLLMTVDAGNLWHAAQQDLLSSVQSKTLQERIPSHLRDPNNRWFGLSVRARTIAYNPKRLKKAELTTYAALADQKFKGKLCLRTAKKVYNQSLVAMFIASYGEKETEKIIRGWVGNLATSVFSSDTKLLEAIASEQCDVGIVNTYYYGRLKRKKPDINLALFWPDQNGQGVHINVSGAGVVKHSKNKSEATKLLEWLSSQKAQRMFADLNLEYPAAKGVKPNQEVESWGTFKASEFNLSKAGELQKAAIMLMDRSRYF